MNADVACEVEDVRRVGGGQVWQKLLLCGGGAYEVEWDTAAAVTPVGSLVYFAQYLSAGGLLDGMCADCPLEYRSGNAPGKREVLGTVVLGVEVRGGKQHAGRHSTPGLWKLLDGLPPACRPRLLRGDVSYGREQTMLEAEARRQGYLFKLRQTTKIRAAMERLERTVDAWSDAGEGWQGTELRLTLMGWSQARRCVFLRRPAERSAVQPALPASTEFDFVQVLAQGPCYESIVLATNTDHPLLGLSQLYRDRADCENVFDEIKNQWGWAGFVTQDLRRCRIMARMIALVYNWWNIFTRLAQPDRHLEAVTSRPLLLHAVGRLVTTARRKIVRLTSTHAMAERIQFVLSRIGEFFNRLNTIAEQWSPEAIWAVILSVAFRVWLRGKALHPTVESNQTLLLLSS